MLKLRYRRDGVTSELRAETSADDLTRLPFTASNGWRLMQLHQMGCSTAYKQLRLGRGDCSCYTRSLPGIAQAVAEFNGRKNVVEIGDEGVLY